MKTSGEPKTNHGPVRGLRDQDPRIDQQAREVAADEQRRAGILVDAYHDAYQASAIRNMLGLPQAVA